MKRAAVLCGVILTCCAPQAGPTVRLSMVDIQPIIEPLTYRELLGEKCGAPHMKVKTAFLVDLKTAGAPAELLAQATAAARGIEAADRDTPNEYVCTVELFESTEKNAAAAQAAWMELKQRKS